MAQTTEGGQDTFGELAVVASVVVCCLVLVLVFERATTVLGPPVD